MAAPPFSAGQKSPPFILKTNPFGRVRKPISKATSAPRAALHQDYFSQGQAKSNWSHSLSGGSPLALIPAMPPSQGSFQKLIAPSCPTQERGFLPESNRRAHPPRDSTIRGMRDPQEHAEADLPWKGCNRPPALPRGDLPPHTIAFPRPFSPAFALCSSSRGSLVPARLGCCCRGRLGQSPPSGQPLERSVLGWGRGQVPLPLGFNHLVQLHGGPGIFHRGVAVLPHLGGEGGRG